MRRKVLPLLSLLSLAFAPAPLPRPMRGVEAPVVEVTVHLRILDASLVAADCQGMLGPGSQVAAEPVTNSLILQGRKSDVGRVLAAVKRHEDGS